MRTLAQMVAEVQRLAHDAQVPDKAKQFAATVVRNKLIDAHNELLDRLIADPKGRRRLYTVTAAQTVAAKTGNVALPTDCMLLDAVDWRGDATDNWGALEMGDPDPEFTGGSAESATAVLLAATTGQYGGWPRGWAPGDDQSSVDLWPATHIEAGQLRFRYFRQPAFPATDAAVSTLPDGADELLELGAALKLLTPETADQTTLSTYATLYGTRFRTFCSGRAAGKFDLRQRQVRHSR